MQGTLFNPPPVLDRVEATARRDDGITRSAEHAVDGFREAAQQAIHRAALRLPEFIVDDVWAAMPPHIRTQDNRAMGAEMLRAVKMGWITKTDRYRPSAQEKCHCNPRRVWRSML